MKRFKPNNFIMATSDQYVILPKKENGELLCKYEILVYVAIRRYMNKNTMKCFPSLVRIMQDTGLSKPTVRKTIKQIVAKGYMETESVPGHGTTYTFNNERSFEPFSYEFLDNPKLTKSEKLQILCTQQYMYKDNGMGKISYSDKDLAQKTGLDWTTIARNNQSLIQKGLASQVTLQLRDPLTGIVNKETIYHLNELGQKIVFALQNHEDRICKNEDDIASLKKDNELLHRELERLLREKREENKSEEFQF